MPLRIHIQAAKWLAELEVIMYEKQGAGEEYELSYNDQLYC